MELTTFRGGLRKMPVVNYHSAKGRLFGETTSGIKTDLSDALGSVPWRLIALYNFDPVDMAWKAHNHQSSGPIC